MNNKSDKGLSQLSSALQPWEEPLGEIAELSPMTDDFLLAFIAYTLDFERMTRSHSIPKSMQAKQAIDRLLHYFAQVNYIHPTLAKRIIGLENFTALEQEFEAREEIELEPSFKASLQN